MNAIQLLNQLDMAEQRRKYPNHPESLIINPSYSDKTANGLTKAVIRYLELNGSQAERVSNQGRYLEGKIIKKGFYGQVRTAGKFIPSSSKNGTSDIHATIPVTISGNRIGISVKIEIKMKDKMSPNQHKYKQEIENSSGEYWVVHNLDEFISKYNELMKKYS